MKTATASSEPRKQMVECACDQCGVKILAERSRIRTPHEGCDGSKILPLNSRNRVERLTARLAVIRREARRQQHARD